VTAARFLLGMLAITAIAVAGVIVCSPRAPRRSGLGTVDAMPELAHLSLRVGKPMHFSAAAPGALGFSWSVSGRPVSHEAAWAFVPRSADAGLQQVKVVIAGRDGTRVRREWDVVVETAVAPELLERTPSGAVISVQEGEPVTLRCAARLPKAGPSDQIKFDWTIDGRAVQRDEHPGAEGVSELVVPAPRPGMYRVVARVSEVDEAASLAEWTLVVERSEPVLEVAAGPPPARVGSAAHGPEIADRRMARASEPAREPERVYLSREGDPSLATEPVEGTVVTASIGRERPATSPAQNELESEIRRWVEEYAQAWSRKDLDTLRRMGHVQTASQAERLQRYFQSVDDLRVDVRVVALHVDGDRISVDLERTETVTDPSGDRQTLRSPLVRKEIERGPHGFRFTEGVNRS
jgi:hypothetical protein